MSARWPVKSYLLRSGEEEVILGILNIPMLELSFVKRINSTAKMYLVQLKRAVD